MPRRPPLYTRTVTLCPYTTLFRSRTRTDVRNDREAEIEVDEDVGHQTIRVYGAAEVRAALGIVVAEVALEFNARSEEHTSELQSIMRISYAFFCLTKKNI